MLDEKGIIQKLNWFYSLEMNQVDLYTVQSKSVEDIYIKKTLERVAVIEEGHVKNISDMIKQYGGKPTLIGEVVAPLTGKIAGGISGMAGVVNLLKADIALEQKAMSDYKDFIMQAGNRPELFDLLWGNLIDEDLHTAWFSNKVKEIQ
ncbi:MAG: ferritin-like domain-containing protein [Dehalobacterium sp.]